MQQSSPAAAGYRRRRALFSALMAAICFASSALVGRAAAQEPQPVAESRSAAAEESPALVRAIHLVEDAEGAGLVLDLSREVPVRLEALNDPPRLVVDLPGAGFSAAAALSGQRAVGPVAAWRAGVFMLGQSRLVLDLAQPALVEQSDFIRQNGAVRLVLPIRRVEAALFAERATADRKARLVPRETEAGAMSPRAANAKPLIMLDPGHGGIDSGALGPRGEQEKEVVLAMALALRSALEADGRVEVAMTRESDVFIPLGERVRLARGKGAALLVSLHADSLRSEREVRGASVYTLAERASDHLAAQAAEKENRADEAAGVDVENEKREGIEDILVDLARRETRLLSHFVAKETAQVFHRHHRLHKAPMRAANFRVLQAPDVPSILIEIGYLTNAEDVRLMSNAPERDALAKDLALQLSDFLLNRRRTISAASEGAAKP